jgi:cobalt-precorrin-5B (C1)-methyltransferase
LKRVISCEWNRELEKKGKLRIGYTTGACAAAASKAATVLLFQNAAQIKNVDIPFPDNSRVSFDIHKCGIISRNSNIAAWASVIKDAGDDPDVTNGAEIVAKVSITRKPEPYSTGVPKIVIKGGDGVGTVTKPGLAVPVGEPAINPVPRKMIKEAVTEAIPPDIRDEIHCLDVTISVADGERIAQKTLNARLGILGGISILGTTGIVRPLSAEAWTATIRISMDVAKAMKREEIVLSSGRSSERIHQETYGFPEESYIMMGDHVEFSFLEARRHGFRKIHICTQWAKTLKIAMRTPQTHVRYGAIEPAKVVNFLKSLDKRIEAEFYKAGDREFNTAREIFVSLKSSMPKRELASVLSKICGKVKEYAESITEDIPVTSYLASYEGDIIAKSG